MSKLQKNIERVLVACSLWLHIGFIGASAVAVGLLQLFDGEARWSSELALTSPLTTGRLMGVRCS